VAGTLFVVATPLGNLRDLSPRALETLREVAWIACEDTRTTGRILARHGIETPTVSCHRFNERARLAPILERLRDGADVALVSDAGTPGISDPGSLLVDAAAREGIRVVPIPGPSAPTALLSAAGLPADRYVFDGFLPHRAGERRKRLRDLRTERRTVLFLESPNRIRESLLDLQEVLGPRRLVVGRELTKIHESILRGSAREILERLSAEQERGEIVLAVSGAQEDAVEGGDERAERILACWKEALAASGGERREALRSAARSLGLKRPELHRLLAELGEI
jgi:16S rRNA (cytidine1402-2'-O)-methyltransferase